MRPTDHRHPSAVAESERQLRFLDELGQATRSLAEPLHVMHATAQALGRHLGVSRCAYAQVLDDQDHFDLLGDYVSGVDSMVGRFAFSDFGETVLALMRAGKPYVNNDIDTDPRTAGSDLTAFRASQIQSVICLPLHKAGRFVAAMAVHQDAPRVWTAGEIELVQMVVDRCWESLDRIRVDKALREAHQRLSLAMAAGELGDWAWDAETDVMVLGDTAADMYGVPRGVPQQRSAMRALIHPDERDLAASNAAHAFAERGIYSCEYRVNPANGGAQRWIFAQGKPSWAVDGAVTGMVGVVQDITAQRIAKQHAAEEANMLEVLNQTGAVLAAELDLQTLLQHATDAATQLTGAKFGAFFYNGTDEQGAAYLLYTLSGAPREAFERFGHPRPTALFGPTFTGNAPIRSSDILQDPRYGKWGPHHGMPPGHLPVRSYLGVPVVSRSGEVIGGLFFGHPDTGVFDERCERLAVGIAGQAAVAVDNARLYAQAQRASEERKVLLENERAARQEAERANTIKDEFLATLSHELRTPLSAIMGWAHILRRKLPAELADLHKGVEVIERSTRVQTQLIEDLLDMSRIVSGKLRLDVLPVMPVTFIEAAIETVRTAADAAGVRIETTLDPLAGPVSGDPGRLQQVVWNLLANAVKFTPRGGKVQVLLERVDQHIEITVADTGMGISAAFLPYIFDRFRQADGSTTRQYGGLGLGLSIVRQLVEQHGGHVRAQSPGEGGGAAFMVMLPVNGVRVNTEDGGERVNAQPENPPPAPPLSETQLTGMRVLVVDDEADARDLLRRVLQESGAQVTVAASAHEALAALDTAWSGGAPFDVLVSDIGMPGTDGYELLRRVRRLGPGEGGDLPAIALTAFARPEDRVKALDAGFAMHVTKPMEPAAIVAAVAGVTKRH